MHVLMMLGASIGQRWKVAYNLLHRIEHVLSQTVKYTTPGRFIIQCTV
jgi:hypothetical protein